MYTRIWFVDILVQFFFFKLYYEIHWYIVLLSCVILVKFWYLDCAGLVKQLPSLLFFFVLSERVCVSWHYFFLKYLLWYTSEPIWAWNFLWGQISLYWGFPGVSGESDGNPLQCSCLENPMDGGAWSAAFHGVAELDATERLHFPFSLLCTGEGNGIPLHCSCLENPRDRGAWWAAIYGVAQSRTQLKQLSSSSSLMVQTVKNPPAMQETWV